MARRGTTRPPVRELQLATLVDAPPEGPDWLHEQKFDGYRILAELERWQAATSVVPGAASRQACP
jgi:ATP-dependent DNA ligase